MQKCLYKGLCSKLSTNRVFTINIFNMRLLIDEEIILKGKDSGFPPTDLLNTMVYAESLQKTIMSADTSKKPFTIGLFGEWGSGKSSIIKTVRDNLEKHSDVEYGFVHYDAWKYSVILSEECSFLSYKDN